MTKFQYFARETIKEGLVQCTDEQQVNFKRMYSPKNFKKSIDDIVKDMDKDQLDWAMQQIQRTLDKNK